MGIIADNLKRVQETIEETLSKTGRKDSVTLIAVTKTVDPEGINEAIEAGIKIIGENRVQEARDKFDKIKKGVTWHLIGHLQRNKVKHALPIFSMIQSIDKVETVREIERRAQKLVDILIEINSSGEESKYGVNPDQVFKLVDEILEYKMINIKGLMTVGPLTTDEKEIRKAFSLTRKKFDEMKDRYKELDITYLSMGMSGDYPIAIEEGSNMVRVGTAIFGPRNY
ncbi:MAG: YggS family pyridoxal phosphate-dependent enzyme [Spirochaetes bacterium]|nr:MAG: YggS family pyridoxal phosphate-dependent enzyme [Spirochaetota bacterium]